LPRSPTCNLLPVSTNSPGFRHGSETGGSPKNQNRRSPIGLTSGVVTANLSYQRARIGGNDMPVADKFRQSFRHHVSVVYRPLQKTTANCRHPRRCRGRLGEKPASWLGRPRAPNTRFSQPRGGRAIVRVPTTTFVAPPGSQPAANPKGAPPVRMKVSQEPNRHRDQGTPTSRCCR